MSWRSCSSADHINTPPCHTNLSPVPQSRIPLTLYDIDRIEWDLLFCSCDVPASSW